MRKAIDDRIIAGIRTGEDALKIARSLEPYLNPAFRSETVTHDGKVIARLNQTTTPGRGGYGNVNTRRLVRTEISRVHAAASMAAARVAPGTIGMKWQLSASHVGSDACSDHARRHSEGMEPGCYTFSEFPMMPEHPQCLCASVPVQMSREDVIADLIRRYGPPMETAA